MNIIIKAAAILYVMFPFQAALARWDVITKKDEMTGDISSYASSDSVGSTRPMGFPYTGIKSQLVFGCDTK